MAGPSGVASYSTNPNVNATVDGGGVTWAENQFPSTVNNSVRQNLADIRAAFNDLMWFSYGSGDQDQSGTSYLGVPYLYSSGTSVQVAGANVTAAHHAGRRMRFIGATTGTIYGTITSSVYSSGTNLTTINLTFDAGATLQNEVLQGYLCQIPNVGNPIPSGALIAGLGYYVQLQQLPAAQNTNYTGFALTNDNAAHVAQLVLSGTAYVSGGGVAAADQFMIANRGLGGIAITNYAPANSAPIIFGQGNPYATGNAEVARFDASGRLLLGATTPFGSTQVLYVANNVNSDSQAAIIQNKNSGPLAASGFGVWNDAGVGALMYAYSSTVAGAGMSYRANGALFVNTGNGGVTYGNNNAATPIYFMTGSPGVEIARFGSSGGLSIGTGADPAGQNWLDMAHNVAGQVYAQMKNTDAGTGSLVGFRATNGTDQNTIMMLGSGYNAGVSTLRARGAVLYSDGPGGQTIYNNSAQPIYFAISQVEVGRFQLTSGTQCSLQITNPNGQGWGALGLAQAGIGTWTLTGDASSNVFKILLNAINPFQLDTGGNLYLISANNWPAVRFTYTGIGYWEFRPDTNNAMWLNLNGGNMWGVGSSGGMMLNASTQAARIYVNGAIGGYCVRIDLGSTSNVGIQNYSNSTAASYFDYFQNPNGVVGAILSSASTTQYSTSSDLRLKKTVRPATRDSGKVIDAIEIDEFDWIADGVHVDFGIVAQKLHKHCPDAVAEGIDELDEDGNLKRPWMIDHSKLVPLLIAEVQSLRRRMKTQETKH